MTTVAQPTRMAHSDPFEDVMAWAKKRAESSAALTLTETTEYALAWARAGVHVAVCAPGTKRPADYRTLPQQDEDAAMEREGSGFYLATTDPARLVSYIDTAYHREGQQMPNLAAHIGWSNLIVVDADNEGDTVEFARYAWYDHDTPVWATTRSPGWINPETGTWDHRDGAHFWFRLPEGTDSSKLRVVSEKGVIGHLVDEDPAHPRAGWDVKVGHKIVLLPLSVRPEGRYEPNTAHGVPDAPQWLVDLCTAPETVSREWDDDDEDTIEFRESVDDALNDISWDEIFEGVAYLDGYNSRCQCPVYTRMGGSHGSLKPHDGCQVAHGSVCCTVNSTTVLSQYPMLEDLAHKRGKPNFSKWEMLAALQFKGDMGAVAKHYGFSRPSADWTTVFAPADKPFTVSVSSGAPAPTTVYADACEHGIPSKECVPCLRARRIAIAAQPTPPAFATTWFDAATAGASRV